MDLHSTRLCLWLCLGLALQGGCPARPSPSVVAPPGPSRPPGRAAAPREAVARCQRVEPGGLVGPVRSVLSLGGFRLLVAGLRVSERPPCAGACASPDMTLALVDSQGSLCFRVTLPDEHRLGPVGRPGGTLFVAGPRRVYALAWDGRRLATTVAEGLRGDPVSLEDGGAAFLDAEGYLLVYRPDGTLRYRKRPETPAAPLALARRPGGGVLVAFGQEVRGYDVDGVEMFKRSLPDVARERRLAGLGSRALWVWSARGAYRFREDGSLGDRLPPRAPKDGQLFDATLGPKGLFFALFAEQGFHPMKLGAFLPTGAPHWSRPYTGARPSRCRLLPATGGQLAVLCEGEPLGRAVVRDPEGLTRFDEELMRPQVAFGSEGAFAVAEDRQAKDMTEHCRVRRFGRSEAPIETTERAGRCPVLWATASGALHLGHERLVPGRQTGETP